jgi:hypothetical protein
MFGKAGFNDSLTEQQQKHHHHHRRRQHRNMETITKQTKMTGNVIRGKKCKEMICKMLMIDDHLSI